uniref:Nudix hydrolase domain-containing protein n=1 Tax=Syphacia muris TaxID=451379 RepID=A0A158R5E6_9BILA
MSEGGKKKAGSSSFEKEEEENDEECEEEAPAADEDKGEVVEEGNLVIEGEKVEGKQEEKVGDVSAKKERSDISTAVAVDNSGSIKSKKPEKEVDRMHDVSRGDSEHQASADKSSSVADEEAGPSVARARPSAEDKEMGVNVKNADETTLRPEQPGYIQSSNNVRANLFCLLSIDRFFKNVPIPRTFHGHMIPMRIEPSERQVSKNMLIVEEVRTHAFVISEPGSSATTEELQVFSEVEQIQAIKNELMNESGWSKHDSIRHDSFQYNGTHVLTEIVGKDGEPSKAELFVEAELHELSGARADADLKLWLQKKQNANEPPSFYASIKV